MAGSCSKPYGSKLHYIPPANYHLIAPPHIVCHTKKLLTKNIATFKHLTFQIQVRPKSDWKTAVSTYYFIPIDRTCAGVPYIFADPWWGPLFFVHVLPSTSSALRVRSIVYEQVQSLTNKGSKRNFTKWKSSLSHHGTAINKKARHKSQTRVISMHQHVSDAILGACCNELLACVSLTHNQMHIIWPRCTET